MDDGSEQKFQWPPLLSLWLSERVHLICDTFHPFHLYLRFLWDCFIIVVAHWTQHQHTPMTFCQRDRSMAPICEVDETMIKVASRCEFFSELLCFANWLFSKIWFFFRGMLIQQVRIFWSCILFPIFSNIYRRLINQLLCMGCGSIYAILLMVLHVLICISNVLNHVFVERKIF